VPRQRESSLHPPDLMAEIKGQSAYAVWVSRFTLDMAKLADFQRWAVPASHAMEERVPEGIRHVGLHTVLAEDAYEIWDVWAFEHERALAAWNLLLQRDEEFVRLRDESLAFAAPTAPIDRRILREVSQRPLLGVTKFGVNI